MVSPDTCGAYYLCSELWVFIVGLLEIPLLIHSNLWIAMVQLLCTFCVVVSKLFWVFFELFLPPCFTSFTTCHVHLLERSSREMFEASPHSFSVPQPLWYKLTVNHCKPLKTKVIRSEQRRFGGTNRPSVPRSPSCLLLHSFRAVQAFLLHSYGCCSRIVLTIASPLRAFLRLVSHGPLRVPPRCHFRFRVNQKKFYSHILCLGFMRGQIRRRACLTIDVRYGSNHVPTTEVVKLQRREFTDIPQTCYTLSVVQAFLLHSYGFRSRIVRTIACASALFSLSLSGCFRLPLVAVSGFESIREDFSFLQT
jgi:hypothetical protein